MGARQVAMQVVESISLRTMSNEPAGGQRRQPVVIANPGDDRRFAARISAFVEEGGLDPNDLQDVLSATYPFAVVRRREISGESLEVWYVYREGHWIARQDGRDGQR
jgi:hypothetical protein